MSVFKAYRVAVILGALSVVFFSGSLILAPANPNVLADFCRHATVALLAGAVTALMFEWRTAYDASLLAQHTAQSTASQIISEVTNIHRNYVPREVFENESLSLRYSGFLNRHFINSDVYRYRGDVAGTTSYQISQIWLAVGAFRKKERRFELLLLHPDSRAAFEQRIEFERDLDEHTLKTGLPEQEKERKANALIDEVYVTLHILHAAANRGEGTDIVVGFYKDVPFYRCEIVQGGLSITYYTKGLYSGTFFHATDSFVYTAFLRAFQVSFRVDLLHLNGLSEEAFLERLRSLGYQGNLLDLGRRARQRVDRIRERHDMLSYIETT